MIVKEQIIEIIKEFIQEPMFLVDVNIRPGNIIVVEVDSDENIGIDDCITLSRAIESKLDREAEDFELEVGSAGLTSPFKILRQYKKNIGKDVEVLTKDGRKLSGSLESCNEETFVVVITKKEKPEGSKKKIEVQEPVSLAYNEVKYTKYQIKFK